MIGFYQHRDSKLHMTPAVVKLVLLLVTGTGLFFINKLLWLVLALLAVLGLYRMARLDLRDIWAHLYPACWLLVFVFAGQLIFNHWTYGIEVVLRLSVLILLASLVTLTTRTSEMMAVIVRVLYPLSLLGVPTDKVGLMLMLTVRYIPLLFHHFSELREAQKARGVKPGMLSLVLPLLVRALRLADQLSEAIEARAYNSQFSNRKQDN